MLILTHYKRTQQLSGGMRRRLSIGIALAGGTAVLIDLSIGRRAVAIVQFAGDKLVHEHIYWDQASVLVQIGKLDPANLPVVGAAAADKVMDKTLPSNALMGDKWTPSAREKASASARAARRVGT